MIREGRAIAHAKVNLELHILAREASDFHGIETVFQRLEVGDPVRVRVGVPGRSLDCGGPEMPAGGLGPTERNLAWRAAMAYAEATGWPDGFAIEVEKRVPAGGGLGGGSADAGAVLRILDALADRPLGEARLVELATPLGSDVPFLTGDACRALAWSRGERMLALPPLPERRVVLVIPPFAAPTAEAYRRLADRRGEWRPAARTTPADALGTWEAVAARAANDFEPVLLDWHPDLRAVLGWLRSRGAAPAMVAGSGSTVFGVFADDLAPSSAEAPPLGRLVHTRTLRRVVAPERIG